MSEQDHQLYPKRRVLSSGHRSRRTARAKKAWLTLRGKTPINRRLYVERGRNVEDGWEVVSYPS